MHNWISLLSFVGLKERFWQQATLWGSIAGLTLGGLFGNQTDRFFWQAEIEWGILGMLLGILSIYGVRQISRFPSSHLTKLTTTLTIALLAFPSWYNLSYLLFDQFPVLRHVSLLWGCLLLPLLAWQLGTLLAFLATVSINQTRPRHPDTDFTLNSPKLLDSSAIIDGRILALCKTGFLQGGLLVPKCILQELQFLADSPHPDKRIRGKRGLEILSQLRTLPTINLVISDDDIQGNLPVDEKLLTLATNLKGIIITNDWNLAQVACLQGLLTLNINELTYELRPLILPGQTIRVFIQKEGQGPGQGAAHLDDGTLVIIDHGRSSIGHIAEVQVTRYMQTNTGRMIFASLTQNMPPGISSPIRPGLDMARAV